MIKVSVTVIVTDKMGRRGTASTSNIEVDAPNAHTAADMLRRALEMLSGNL